MTSNYNFVLNFNNSKPVNTGYTFKTGDKGITFNFDVRELDPTGMTPKIAFHRANATSVESDSVTGSGSSYSYTILGNEFAVPGVVVADLKFYDGDDQRVSSASFIFGVIADTLDGLGGGTDGYSDELEQLSETMEGYIEAFGNLTPINPRGAYDANEEYNPADCVSYNGISWICIQDCTGVTPAEGVYWQKMADPDSTKADKVAGATNGNFAALDANGNLTDSGHKHSDYDASGKANKVAGATSGNLASLTATGDLADSGVAASDIATKADQSSIAPVENGATASQQIVAGSAFYRNGEMCRAKTTIASGEAFTLNTNYLKAKIGVWVNIKTACTWDDPTLFTTYVCYDDGNNYFLHFIAKPSSAMSAFQKIVTFPKNVKDDMPFPVFGDGGDGKPIASALGLVRCMSNYANLYCPTTNYFNASFVIPHV